MSCSYIIFILMSLTPQVMIAFNQAQMRGHRSYEDLPVVGTLVFIAGICSAGNLENCSKENMFIDK